MGVYGKAVLIRLRDALKISDARGAHTKLADRLGISRSHLHEWQKNDQVGFVRVLDLCAEEDLDLNHIFFGRSQPETVEIEILDIDPTIDDPLQTLEDINLAVESLRKSLATRKV
ncbi:MAG: helix-turn-helix domain-containing protein [Candidatus Kapaibacterium sp.]